MKNIDSAKMLVKLNDVRCLLINNEIYCKSYHNYLEGIVENIELIIKNNKKIKIISLKTHESLKCSIISIKYSGSYSKSNSLNAIVNIELIDDLDQPQYMYSPAILLK